MTRWKVFCAARLKAYTGPASSKLIRVAGETVCDPDSPHVYSLEEEMRLAFLLVGYARKYVIGCGKGAAVAVPCRVLVDIGLLAGLT